MIDKNEDERGHRKNLFGLDKDLATLKEIGVGLYKGDEKNKDGLENYLTQDFERQRRRARSSLASCTPDENKNGFYDPGEGLAGVTITPDQAANTFAVTSMSGVFYAACPGGAASR